MNRQFFTDLAEKARSGDANAMETLLTEVFHPVYFLCSHIMLSESAAWKQTQGILTVIYNGVKSMKDPDRMVRWIQKLVAGRCSHTLARMRWEDGRIETYAQLRLPGKLLDEDQTANAVLDMICMLPEDQRLCVLLYFGAGMPVKGIERHTGLTDAVIRSYLEKAQLTIQDQLRVCKLQGYTFLGIAQLSVLMQTAMQLSRDERKAAIMVDGILGKTEQSVFEPTKPRKKKKNSNIRLGIWIALLSLVLMAALGFIISMELFPGRI